MKAFVTFIFASILNSIITTNISDFIKPLAYSGAKSLKGALEVTQKHIFYKYIKLIPYRYIRALIHFDKGSDLSIQSVAK